MKIELKLQLMIMCSFILKTVLTAFVLLYSFITYAAPGQVVQGGGEGLYQQNCGHCHDKPVGNAPHRVMFSMLGSHNIYHALSKGVMKAQGSMLSDEQKRELAEYLGESSLDKDISQKIKLCESNKDINKTTYSSSITGWGMGIANQRFVKSKNANLKKEDIHKLKLKWAFEYPNATRARSQPTVHNGIVYIGSQSGDLFALELDTGCVLWTYKAQAEIRTAVSLSLNSRKALFGDFDGNIYAVDMDSGKQIWQVKLNDHPELTITGSPSLHADTLYVPMSSREWATAAAPDYQCCSFRGGVVALNIHNGERRWTTYTVNKPTQTNEKNAFGTPFLAPSGAPVWNSPTIDVKRGLLYVGTGENYSSPASEKSDAVVAIELSTGAIKWFYQSIKGDAWNMSCLLPGGTNCPKEKGPDFDIGASVVLHTLENGKDILLVGQKSGHVFALDPDKLGALIWKKKIGRGGFLGGIHWGMTAQNNTLYAPIADTILFPHEKGASFPGLFSIDALTGKTNWYMETKNRCKKEDGPGCDAGLSASVSSIDGVVFAGGLDGYFYAVDTKDGSVLWEFNTNKRFQTVSGETAKGGSIESDGAVIIDGHVLVNSGYSFGGRMPGNVLLVFTVDGK